MKDIQYATNGGRIRVYKYHTDRFKSENISIYFELPINKEKSVARSLLLSVLKRGTELSFAQFTMSLAHTTLHVC